MLKLKVAVKVPLPLCMVRLVRMFTLGRALLAVTVTALAASLVLPAASRAAAAGTARVMLARASPEDGVAGVIMARYVVPAALPSVRPSPLTGVGAAAVPPVTVISATASKPLTASSKVKVAAKARPLWAEGALMATVGAVVSVGGTVTAVAAVLPRLAALVATLAATFSTTSVLLLLGVMVTV